MSTDPTAPLSPMAEAVIQMHELFTSLTEGGFTERQACMIIGEMLRNGDKQQ